MEDYKQDIISTRVGSLGSSDATMLARIADMGEVPKSAYKRLAVCKGLIENENTPITAAMAAGDEIENAIYKHISATDERYQSNPLWVSKKYSKHNVRLISHPDIVLVDETKKTIFIYEVKTTSDSVFATKDKYRAQLFVHYTIGKELANEHKWRVKLYLLHYDTNGLDLSQGIEFDPQRLTKHEIRFTYPLFDIEKGMTIVSDFLDCMTEYYAGDEIEQQYLPEQVRCQFDSVATMVAEVKEREARIEEFKQKLYDWMLRHDIKSLKGDLFSITRVDAFTQVSVDYKTLFEREIAAKTPRKAKKMEAKYRNVKKRKGYVTIKEKTKKVE